MQPLRGSGHAAAGPQRPDAVCRLPSGLRPFFPERLALLLEVDLRRDLTDAAIATIVHCGRRAALARSEIDLWHLGGAIGRVGSGATAWHRRDAPYLFTPETTWTDPRTPSATSPGPATWRRCAASQGGMYLNFAGFGEEKDALVRAAYGPNHDRLVQLKTHYDPTNLFRMNNNIDPAGIAAAAD